MEQVEIVLFVFDGLTALDIVGPYEVLQRVPGARVTFAAKERGVVRTDTNNFGLAADRSLGEVTSANVLVVPGGIGTRGLEKDDEVLEWIRRMDATSTWTTSVCTGSHLLGAAGLLRGREATTHWARMERLREWGAIPVSRRVVEQGKLVTAAGVSAGIDMALLLVARLAGDEVAQTIQLGIEYDPQPPFNAGSALGAPAPRRERILTSLALREKKFV